MGTSSYKERRAQIAIRTLPTNSSPVNIDCGFAYEDPCFDSIRKFTAPFVECTTVLYTTNIGAYNDISLLNITPDLKNTCVFMFIDGITSAVYSTQLLNLQKKQPFWKVHVIMDIVGSPQFLVKVLKLLAHRFFPYARRSLYFDGKISFKVGVLSFLDVALMDGRVFVAAPHPDPERTSYREAAKTYKRLKTYMKIGGARMGRRKDLFDLDAQYSQYKLEKYEPSGFMFDTHFVARVHTPEVALFECAWISDVGEFSHREQVSIVHVADILGMRNMLSALNDKPYIRVKHHKILKGVHFQHKV